MKKLNLIFKLSILLVSTSAYSLTASNSIHTDEVHPESVSIELTVQQQQLAGITIEPLKFRPLGELLIASGEVRTNGYTSYFVSPRVQSVVVKRHAILGEKVHKGQPLVTLYSEVVAQTQADYRIAYADWQRTKNLSTAKAVSEQQQLSSKTKLISLKGQLKAYGLEETAIKEIINNESLPLGEYVLVAKRQGSVLSDDFHQGQGIDSGETIMVLTDETQLWVEARLPAANKVLLPLGSQASIKFGEARYTAKVIQAAHTIDPVTRTRTIRLLVNNTDDQLHAGLFVDVVFSNVDKNKGLAVPQSALMRSDDGDWQLFIEKENNQFLAIEVSLGDKVFLDENAALWNEVVALDSDYQLLPGARVVVEGVFFLASEAKKSGFDTHNH